MTDDDDTAARPASKPDWTLYGLLALLALIIGFEKGYGFERALAVLQDLLGQALAWAMTGVWVALAVTLFWPWIRLWMMYVVMIAVVWATWRIGGY
ncbi:hypothetical protein [Bosea beijingensis]|uniref:hypothetical protein n=1 Tax=Bosea beijingensis TaxID=3068632 RepID=UPI002741930B|nr:hypothetical protein [Bosea sp. REN20]